MTYEELQAAYERRGQELLECAAELAQCRETCLDGERLFYFREELEALIRVARAAEAYTQADALSWRSTRDELAEALQELKSLNAAGENND